MPSDDLLEDLAAGFEAHGYRGTYRSGAWVGESGSRAVVLRPDEDGIDALIFWDSGTGLFQLGLVAVRHRSDIRPAVVWSDTPMTRGNEGRAFKGAR